MSMWLIFDTVGSSVFSILDVSIAYMVGLELSMPVWWNDNCNWWNIKDVFV